MTGRRVRSTFTNRGRAVRTAAPTPAHHLDARLDVNPPRTPWPNRVLPWLRDISHRRYLYSVASALSVVLVGYGVATTSKAGLILALIGVALGLPNGLAAANSKPPTR